MGSFIERWRKPKGYQKLILAGLVLVLIGSNGWLVFQTGGTKYVWLHLMYIPILLSAAAFNVAGGLCAALLAGLVLGPYMPLDIDQHIAQSPTNWLIRAGLFMLTAVISGLMFSRLNLQLDRIRSQALLDARTGLPNLHSLQEQLDQAYSSRRKMASTPYLAILDFINLREIINTFGYRPSQNLIQQIVQRFDIVNEQYQIYRVSMERFAILGGQKTLSEHYLSDCKALLNRFEKPFMINDIPISLNLCIGIAQPNVADSTDELIQKASIAAQNALKSGMRYAIYSKKDDTYRVETIALLGSLNDAIANNELALYFQPKIDIQSDQVVGAETLIRWHHPREGLIKPNRYIPQAEKTWLAYPLSMFAIRSALRQLGEWQDAGISLKLAVNLTARNIQNRAFIKEAMSLIRQSSIDMTQLEFEITERFLVTDTDRVAQFLVALKKLGVNILLDDFGTDYASIGLLKRLPVDAIKIDKSLIQHLDTSVFNQSATWRIIQSTKDLKIQSVAEGVESKAILQKLKGFGCDQAQGYYFSPPLSRNDFDHWLSTSPWNGSLSIPPQKRKIH
jgi:EAL domain-containing protein (putative c-di-GMP-specific phosphodiesterase class I)/GGDEF domain-containing protein